MRDYNYSKIILSIFVFMSSLGYSKINFPPTYQKIVTDITITDPDDTSTEAVYIQIS